MIVVALVLAGVAIAGGGGGGGRSRAVHPAQSTGSAASPPGGDGGAGVTSSTRARPPARRSAPDGPFRVGQVSLTLTEPATAGGPVRRIPVVVRYPAAGNPAAGSYPAAAPATARGPFPLVVFSQGFNVAADAYAGLLDDWARAGYVVADPTYPLTDPTEPGGVDENDIVNHPADLRFVIASLRGTAGEHGSLRGLIDSSRVATVGHSDGGDVTLAVAANSCCRDSAITAAVVLSGAELGMFGGSYYTAGTVPLLVVQGSADTINVPGCSAQLYDAAPRPKYYVDLPGAEHQLPYLQPGPLHTSVARSVVAFLDAYVKRRPASLTALVGSGRVPGGATITSAAIVPAASTVCPGAP